MEHKGPSEYLYVLEMGKKCPMISAGLIQMLAFIDHDPVPVLTLNECLVEL